MAARIARAYTKVRLTALPLARLGVWVGSLHTITTTTITKHTPR